MLNKLNLLLVLAVLCNSAIAQKKTTSVFSRYNLGDLENQSFTYTSALGHATTAIRSKDHLVLGNPAACAEIDTNSFFLEFGMGSRYQDITTDNETIGSFSSALDYIAIGFPLSKIGGLQFGLLPYSNTGYTFKQEDSSFDSLLVTNILDGSGSITRFFLESGFDISNFLSIGGGVSYLFGTTISVSGNIFSGEKDGLSFLSASKQTKSLYRGFVFNSGLQAFKEFGKYKVIAGAEYTFASEIYSNEINSKAIFNDTLTYEESLDLKTEVPSKLSVGASLAKGNQFLITTSYSLQDWNGSLLKSRQESTLGTFEQLSFGAEITPDYRSKKFFKRTSYRFGVHTGSTYLNLYTPDNTYESVSDFGMTFGFGFSKRRTSHSLNVSCDIGKRSISNNNLIEGRYAFLKFNFTLHDTNWFEKRKIN